MAQTAQSLQDVTMALRDADGFLERFGVEYEVIPADLRQHFMSIGLGAKKLQVAVARLADVVLQLQTRIEEIERGRD